MTVFTQQNPLWYTATFVALVAIVALLVAILLPSLKEARVQARKIACGTNLHSIGQAVYLYTEAQKDYYPPAGSWPENG